jgi:hypothetical protein
MSSNNASNKSDWYEALDDNLGLPSSDILEYKPIDIVNIHGLDTSIADTVAYFFIIVSIISMVFLYFRVNGYSLGNFFKGLHKHMYLVGKGPKKTRVTSVKKVIIPNT